MQKSTSWWISKTLQWLDFFHVPFETWRNKAGKTFIFHKWWLTPRHIFQIDWIAQVFKRGSRGTFHTVIQLWSAKQLLALLYKDNQTLFSFLSSWLDPPSSTVVYMRREGHEFKSLQSSVIHQVNWGLVTYSLATLTDSSEL